MPRLYVNSMANFVIQGGMVSFTLQDQALRTEGGQPRQAPPEDVVDLVMREQDFVQLLTFLNQHLAAYQQQTGKQIAAPGQQGQQGQSVQQGGAQGQAQGKDAPSAKPTGPGGQAGGGFRIRPKGS